MRKLPLYGKLFGAPGWRSPLRVSTFRPARDGAEFEGRSFQQEFVAIDRFTGGGEEGKKFNALSRYRPVLEGWIELDLAACQRARFVCVGRVRQQRAYGRNIPALRFIRKPAGARRERHSILS